MSSLCHPEHRKQYLLHSEVFRDFNNVSNIRLLIDGQGIVQKKNLFITNTNPIVCSLRKINICICIYTHTRIYSAHRHTHTHPSFLVLETIIVLY